MYDLILVQLSVPRTNLGQALTPQSGGIVS